MKPELLAAFERLTALQKRFVGFLAEGCSPTDAYIQAGGTAANGRIAASVACVMAKDANVNEYMKLVNGGEVNLHVMSAAEMRKRLSDIARASVHKVVKVKRIHMGYSDDGEELWVARAEHEDFDNVDETILSAVSEVSVKEHGITIKMQSSLQAMKQLAELQGTEAPKRTEITGAGGTAIKILSLDPNEASREYIEMMG